MSDTMEEGVLVAWLAEEGDAVTAGDVIAQVETDKATMDLEVYDDGVLLKKVVREGEAVPIGALIAVLGQEGEDPSSVLEQFGGAGGADARDVEEEAEKKETPEAAGMGEQAGAIQDVEASDAGTADRDEGSARHDVTAGDGMTTEVEPRVARGGTDAVPETDDGRVKASPLARKLAREHDIRIASVQGTGPEGRIIKRDIEALLKRQPAPGAAPTARERKPVSPVRQPGDVVPTEDGPAYEVLRISQMRKAIARRLSQSKFTAPHFYLTIDVEMEKVDAFRGQLNALAEAQERAKISFNDLITKACALALRAHPMVNASYLEQEGEIRMHNQVHVAVAVAMDEGLITPVIRNADRKSVSQIAEETRALAQKAREKKLEPNEYEGSTFTTSNLGMFGIEEFTAIINPPNACILAIGGIRDLPVVKDGQVLAGKRMKLTLSCDHRVVDGATGARFMGTLRDYLQEPLNLLL